ncbi:MAG: SRPBCC family protein [Gemmatimonadaceae bacterium]
MVFVYVIGAAIAAFLGYVATRPGDFRIQRSLRINATPERIYPHIADFHKWTAWSPWENIDPALTRTYSGAESGVGAAYAWQGNKKVGEGSMEITKASAPHDLTIKLDFLKPFEAHNTTQFTLAPSGGATDVTWAMYGPSAFMSKMMGVFFNMEKFVGGDFEKGLAGLKTVAEA